MSYGTVNTNLVSDSSGGVLAPISSVMRNRIINGAMVIDQRNAGASVTIPASITTYTVDRWGGFGSQASKFSVQQNAGSVTPPTGFINYLGATSLSSYTVGASELFILIQNIEGLNATDLGWGTANAKTVTLSFWVRSSLTGTFGGYFSNSAQNRSYPFSYTISAANTWEQKSVTIAGDTTGTWLRTNGIGIQVGFNLGSGSTFSGTANTWAGSFYSAPTGATSVVGTNGATFYITGVQLEVGTQATSFEYRQYGTELALCQRYLPAFNTTNQNAPFAQGQAFASTFAYFCLPFKVSTRVPPTGMTSSAASSFYMTNATYGAAGTFASLTFGYASNESALFYGTTSAGLVAGDVSTLATALFSSQILFTGCEL
jgi:hypothetical protein